MKSVLIASMVACAGLAVALPASVRADDKAAAPAGAQAAPTLDLKAPLPTDERLVTGTLPNGLSYIVAKHSNPPGRAVMYIHVSSGSLNETDKQRGIAHYLEHMAFNGSENFPAGTVVDFFQSMGLTFGQHQNAFTSFDQTTYILAFPDTKPETLERGMKFFGDVAQRLALSPEEIDKERQVILEEKRTRAGGRQRMQEYVLERLVPGSLVGQRLPIGTEETVGAVQRQDFLDYYGKWYVPSNMTVMVVADADPKVVVDQIAKSFSGGEKKPKPVDQDPKVSPTKGTRAIVASDKEQTRAEVEVVRVWPKESPTVTVGDFRRDLVQNLGAAAFNRRIGAKLAKGGASYTSASGGVTGLFNTATVAQASADGEPSKWKEMLAELGADVQRARLHGFTPRELEDVKAQLLSSAEEAVERESTAPARALIGEMNNSVASGDALMGAKQELEMLKRVLPTITPEEVSASFAHYFDPSDVVFVLQAPTDTPGGLPTESELVEAGRKAFDVKPAAESESDRPTTLMAKAPEPGKVAQQDEHAATHILNGWLSNGVRFHQRTMDYKKDEVTVTITLAAGQLQETAADRGVSDVAALAWGRPATTSLTSTNIRDLMNGKKVGVRGGIGMDTASITISGSPKDLEEGFKLAHLMLTEPKVETAAFDRWKTAQLQQIAERKKMVEGVFAEALQATLFPPAEARLQPLTEEQVKKLTPEAGQAWLTKMIRTAPAEVSVVGDLPRERALELVTAYLGSLPQREKISDKTLSELRVVAREKGPRRVERTLDTQTDKAYVACGFYACDMENVPDRRDLQVASRIVSTRMLKKIREEEQLAYSPSAGLRPGVELPGFGTFALMTQTKPTKADRLAEAAKEIYDDFAKSGPTAEEMTTVKKQIANMLDEQMREPSFWLGQTSTLTYRGSNLDNAVTAPEYYEKLTGEKVQATFRKYYVPENQMAVIVRPAQKAEASEGSAKGEPAATKSN